MNILNTERFTQISYRSPILFLPISIIKWYQNGVPKVNLTVAMVNLPVAKVIPYF